MIFDASQSDFGGPGLFSNAKLIEQTKSFLLITYTRENHLVFSIFLCACTLHRETDTVSFWKESVCIKDVSIMIFVLIKGLKNFFFLNSNQTKDCL